MFLKHTAFIALGANLGDPEKQIEQAIEILSGSVQIVKISSFYHSKALVLLGQLKGLASPPPSAKPLEPPPQRPPEADWLACPDPQDIPDYTNAVALIHTELEPLELLDLLLAIENQMGRTRRVKWESRVIDLDVLTYDDLILQSDHL